MLTHTKSCRTNFIIKDVYDNYVATATGNNAAWGTYSSGTVSNSQIWAATVQDDGTVRFDNQNSNYKNWNWHLGAYGLSDNSQVAPYRSDKTSPANYSWLCSEPCDITDVTLSVNATAGWGTFIAPYDNLTPEDVKAYSVSYKNGSTVYFEENTTGVLSANTPYILSTDATENVSVQLKGIGYGTEPTYTVNGLVGLLTTDATVPVGSYVLQYQQDIDGTAFYKVAEAMTGTINRCYLNFANVSTEVPAGARAAVSFHVYGDEQTGIAHVGSTTSNELHKVYNLQGQRMQQAVKGLYIVDGKKIIVK